MKTRVKPLLLILVGLGVMTGSGAAQSLSARYSFRDTNEVNPTAVGLLLSSNTIFGTTFGAVYSGGGKSNRNLPGTLFQVNADGSGFTNLYIFSKVDANSLTNTDGANPTASLVWSGTKLYGATEYGGFYNHGTVFAINPDGTGFTNLYNFSAAAADGLGNNTNSDGANPAAGLVPVGNKLYGTTSAGGLWGGGTVFALNADGTGFTNLYNFNPTNGDGSGAKPLILSGTRLFGTTSSGRSSANGTVFALNSDGTGFTNLHVFSSLVRETTSPFAYTNGDGAQPQGGVVLSGDMLYGTANAGGDFGNGTVFALHTDGTDFTNLHSLTSGDGSGPNTGLVLAGNTLYGTARIGGSLSQQNGTVFALNTDGTGFAALDTFPPRILDSGSGGYTNEGGAIPVASMVMSGNTLFGATEYGGTNGSGIVFALNLAAVPPTLQFTANRTNGLPPLAVQFNAPAVDTGSNSILSWSWNFGDGATGVGQSPAHTYTNQATFLPSLTCINDNGTPVRGLGPAIAAAYSSSILNGGFETGSFTNWTQSGYFFSSGVATGVKYAHAGTYGAALETGGAPGFLSQSLATTPGAEYLISFWLNSSATNKPNDFQVLWNGAVLLDKTNLAAIGWTNIQLTVPATATSTTLQFEYLNSYFYFGLDDITVTPATHPNLTSVSVTGMNLVLSGINGVSGTTNYLLMGTNLTQPLNDWTPVATNVLGTNGNFSITATNTVDSTAPGRFFILKLQ